MLTVIAPRPRRSRRRSALPCSFTMGCPSGVRRISISRHPTPRTPRPSTFDTASFAAHRPARCSTLRRQYARSQSVYTRRRKRSPNLSRTCLMRAVSMMSTPTSATALTVSASTSFDGDRLREVARLIDVGAAAIGDVVGEELQRHYRHDRRDELVTLGQRDDLVGLRAKLLVVGVRERHDDAGPRAHLLDVRKHLAPDRVARRDREHGQVLVDERVSAVLHLTGCGPLGVRVRELLQLERALEGG